MRIYILYVYVYIYIYIYVIYIYMLYIYIYILFHLKIENLKLFVNYYNELFFIHQVSENFYDV